MRRSGAPDTVGSLVAYKNRRNALKNPYAHLHEHDITLEKVQASPMLWDPIRYSETCPSSDGAVAMVLTDRAGAARAPRPAAWMHGGAMRSEPTLFAGKDSVSPRAGRDCAADVYRQAGIADPRREIDAVEMYVPFSWYEPMWLENLGFAAEGEGWKLTESGVTELDGDLPVDMSGGVLSTNPIGASGMIRFAEAALQVRGWPESTRLRAPAGCSGTPTAADRSSSRCGSWAPSRRPPEPPPHVACRRWGAIASLAGGRRTGRSTDVAETIMEQRSLDGWHKPAELDLSNADWRSSSQGRGDVQIAFVEGFIAMRNSGSPESPSLIFTPAEWGAFVSGAREGEFDLT